MAEHPAMMLWTDAYLADTTHLTTIEHGAYLLLLMAMWRTSSKSLPYDDLKLARFARLNIAQWRRMKPTLMELFTVDGDQITQGRLTDEAIAVKRKRKSQSDKAKAKWLKYREARDAVASSRQCRNDASLTLTLTHKEDNIPPPPSEGIHPNASPNGSAGKPAVDPRGSRLKADWEPGEKGVAYARSLGMSDDAINETYHAFMRYWLAKAGKDARKVDWLLTWQTWVRRENERLREQADRERRLQERYGSRAVAR